jgi:hypothetical protein
MKTKTNNTATRQLVVGTYRGITLYIGPKGGEPMGVETMEWQSFVEDCPVMGALLKKMADGTPHYV